VGETTVAESNPSPAADYYATLSNQSLAGTVVAPTDPQVTHVRIYRSGNNGIIYYRDQDIPINFYAYGYCHAFEAGYLTGNAYKFTSDDSAHSSDNAYTWEATAESQTGQDTGGYGGGEWYLTDPLLYQEWLAYLASIGQLP
jgi:hypothetical protein